MRLIYRLFLLPALCLSLSASAETPDYIGKHVTTPVDLAAINQVIETFRTAIINKDPRTMNSLMLDTHVLFNAAPPPDLIRKNREKYDINFDGVLPDGLQGFNQYLGEEKQSIEEKFYNIKITQDANTAWVAFDYEFQIAGKTTNYGIETWQLIQNADAQWKIISVVWTVHMPDAK